MHSRIRKTEADTDVGLVCKANHERYYDAQERGYFAEQGLEVEIQSQLTQARQQNSLRGKVDLAVTYQP